VYPRLESLARGNHRGVDHGQAAERREIQSSADPDAGVRPDRFGIAQALRFAEQHAGHRVGATIDECIEIALKRALDAAIARHPECAEVVGHDRRHGVVDQSVTVVDDTEPGAVVVHQPAAIGADPQAAVAVRMQRADFTHRQAVSAIEDHVTLVDNAMQPVGAADPKAAFGIEKRRRTRHDGPFAHDFGVAVFEHPDPKNRRDVLGPEHVRVERVLVEHVDEALEMLPAAVGQDADQALAAELPSTPQTVDPNPVFGLADGKECAGPQSVYQPRVDEGGIGLEYLHRHHGASVGLGAQLGRQRNALLGTYLSYGGGLYPHNAVHARGDPDIAFVIFDQVQYTAVESPGGQGCVSLGSINLQTLDGTHPYQTTSVLQPHGTEAVRVASQACD